MWSEGVLDSLVGGLGYRKSKGRMAVKSKQTKEKGISQLAFFLVAWPGLG